MRRRTFRGGVGLALLALLGMAALLVPSGAAAQDGEDGLQPPAGYEEFADCPTIEAPVLAMCLNISATGDLNLGDVDANIDEPLELALAINVAGLGGDPPEIVLAEGEGSDPVRVPGGLLGIEELDPVADLLADELGLNVLTVDARPNLGEPEANVEEMITWMLLWGLFAPDLEANEVMTGQEIVDLIEGQGGAFAPQSLGLPLDIELGNMLFGNSCGIGSADEPILINATTGETSPPDGVDPINGALGDFWFEIPEGVDGLEGEVEIRRWHGNAFVDNGFAVPGPEGCNTLGGLGYEGTAVESLVNLDSLLGSQTGLPSDAGQNEAAFEFDFDMAWYPTVHGN